jgi:uncharacterized protein
MKRVAGTFTVRAPPHTVLEYCADLRNVFLALPGLAEIKEATAESGVVVVNAGVSFIRGRFTVRIAQTERTESRLRFQGHGDGVGNAVDFESTVDVSASDSMTTEVNWASDVRVHGPVASMAAGLLDPVISQNVELFVTNLKKGLENEISPSPAPVQSGIAGQRKSFLKSVFEAIVHFFYKASL